jgi:hypothetical protein
VRGGGFGGGDKFSPQALLAKKERERERLLCTRRE